MIRSIRALSLLSLPFALACTVHHIDETETGGSSVVVREGPARFDLRDEIAPGSGISSTLGQTPDTALAHPFIGRAGATVSARLENGPADTHVSLRGPIPEGADYASAPILITGDGRIDLPADGVYLAVVWANEQSMAGFDLYLDCHSEECRPECGPAQACPANSRCYFVQCVTAPCPSFCQVDLPQEEAAPVHGDANDTCGTRGAPPCAAGLFCDFPLEARCGEVDHPGRCHPVPGNCTDQSQPVCGCNGRSYANVCEAQRAGVSVRSDGACAGQPVPTPGAGAGQGGDQAGTGPGCMRTGCSSQICTEVGNEQVTTCEARPEYACLRHARCERQANGQCNWTRPPEFEACIQAL